jgi:hemolysin activation/secretion protein
MKKKYIILFISLFLISSCLYLFFSPQNKKNESITETFSKEEKDKLKEIEKKIAENESEFNFDEDLKFDIEEDLEDLSKEDNQNISNEPKNDEIVIEKAKIKEDENFENSIIQSSETIESDIGKSIEKEDPVIEKEFSNDEEVNNETAKSENKIIEEDYDIEKIEKDSFKNENTENETVLNKKEIDNISLPKMKGLILASNEKSAFDLNYEDVNNVELVGLNIPGNYKDLSNEIESLYFDKDISKDNLLKIKQSIISYYIKNNRPLVTVNIPNQDITTGVIAMIVQESRLNEIVVVGNKYTNSKILKNRISVKPHQKINEKKLRKDIDFLNLNPFRRVDLIYSEGENENSTDIELLTSDRFPLRVYAGSDNTGIKIIERNRWFVGFNWNEAFTIDSVLSYQYTSSYNLKNFQSHTGNYTIYLPWENILTLYGGYSLVKVEHHIPTTMKNDGKASQASLLYTIPLPIFKNITHDLIFGFDFKRTNTNYLFTDLDNFLRNRTTNLTQFLISYNFNYEKNAYKTNLKLDVYSSFFEWLPDQSNANFDSLRSLAKNEYIYTRLYFSNLFRFDNNMLFSFVFRAQLSNENLLPSEMLGIGGYDSVRGYYERDLNGDGGMIINAEFRSPSFSILKNLKYKKARDSLQLIAFFDYGLAEIHETILSEHKTEYIFGFGPGIRYVIEPYFTTRLDWGFKGIHNPSFGGGESLLHFSINLSY